MNLKKEIKRWIFLFSFLPFLLFFPISTTYANDKAMDVKMKNDGTIQMITVDTTATSAIVFRTDGFSVCKTKTKGTPLSVGKGNYGIFMLSEGERKSQENPNGTSTVTFTFSEEYVENQFDQINFELEAGGTVYLNGIFNTYSRTNGIYSYRKGPFYSLNAIQAAEPWRNPDDFREYFDIPLTYSPRKQPVQITYMEYNKGERTVIATDHTSIEDRPTRSKVYGTAERIPTSKVSKKTGETYYLYRVYYSNLKENGADGQRVVHGNIGTERNPYEEKEAYLQAVSEMRSRAFKVPVGGLEIVAVYKKMEKKEVPKVPVYIQYWETNHNTKTYMDHRKIEEMEEGKSYQGTEKDIPNSYQSKKTGELYYLYRVHWSNLSDEKGEDGLRPIHGLLSTKIEPKDGEKEYRSAVKELRERDFSVPKGGLVIVAVYRKMQVPKAKVQITYLETNHNIKTRLSMKKLEEQEELSTISTDQTLLPTEKKSKKTGKTYYLYRVHWSNLNDSGEDGFRKEYDIKSTSLSIMDKKKDYLESLKEIRERTFSIPKGGLEIVAVYKNMPEGSGGGAEESTEITESIKQELKNPQPNAVIYAEHRGKETFDVIQGIPTTEKLYANVFTEEYLLDYIWERVKGEKVYSVPVKKTYVLSWTTAGLKGTLIPMSETQTVTQYITVKRSYSYWIVKGIHLYIPSSTTLKNYALPNGTISIKAKGIQPILQYTKTKEHLKEPVIPTIDLGTQQVMGGSSKPVIPEPNESWKRRAEESIEEIVCKNDSILFQGKVYMDSTPARKQTASPIPIPPTGQQVDKNVFYHSGMIIDGTKENGFYSSTGNVTYKEIVGWGDSNRKMKESYPILGINPVVIHTPVFCEGMVEDVREFNQMISPDKNKQGLVLDRYFTVSMSNIGQHKSSPGYGYRDYIKYTASQQVKFPFDIYQGNTFYKAGTWIENGTSNRYYLPAWVKEGNYTISFRSLAVNGRENNKIGRIQEKANYEKENYTAIDEKEVQVSGRIFGLYLFDISDYPIWKPVFRKKDGISRTGFTYTVGINDQNGNNTGQKSQYTLPLVNGSHPSEKNAGVVKTGYMVRFGLTTIGDYDGKEDYIRIIPEFYFLDAKTGKRQPVDIYYRESEKEDSNQKKMIKIGSAPDRQNKKSIVTGDRWITIPKWECSITASIRKLPLIEYMKQKKYAYTFGNIMIPDTMMTAAGKAEYFPVPIKESGKTEQEIASGMQHWYGEYYLPSEIHILPKGFDFYEWAKKNGSFNFSEDIWLKNGYIIVNFQIETVKDGKRHLSYINQSNSEEGYCNMWKMEGAVREKEDSRKQRFQFIDGDFILYYADRSIEQDFHSYITH